MTVYYFVTPFTLPELEEVIEKPADKHGVTLERGLVPQIIADVMNQPGGLPLLQYALAELWRVCITESPPNSQLTCRGYEQIRGVKGALEKRANDLYQNLAPADKVFVRRLFLALVQLGEAKEVTRRRASWQELEVSADSQEQLLRVTRQLASQEQRLIITDEKTVEVAHEALLSEWRRLKEWIEQDRENLRVSRRLEAECKEWQRNDRSEGLLLTDAWLAAINGWVEKTQPRLSPLEQEFLKESLEKRDRELQAKVEQERQLREAAEARAMAELEKAIEADGRASAVVQKNRLLVTAVCLLTVVLALSFGLKQEAENREKAAIDAWISRPQHLYRANNQLEALIESVKILKQLQTNKSNQSYTLNLLQPIISGVRERNRLEGYHNDEIVDVSFSPDGSLIASASQDRTVRLWTKEGKALDNKTLKHGNRVWGVDFNPLSQIVATSSEDGIVRLWQVSDSSLKQELQPPREQRNGKLALRVNFSLNGQMIASANFDNTVRVWQLSTKQVLKTFRHDAEVNSVSFSPNSKEIASASSDRTVRLWSLSSDNVQPLQIFRGHTDEVFSVSFSPDRQYIASGSRDRTIRIWNLLSKEPPKVLEKHRDMVYSVSFSPDGQYIASGSKDGTVKLWSKEGNPLATFKHGSPVLSVSFSPTEKIIASAGADRVVKIWSFGSSYTTTTNTNELLKKTCVLVKNYIENNPFVSQEDRNVCNIP